MSYDYGNTSYQDAPQTDDIIMSLKIHHVMKGYDIYRAYNNSGVVFNYKVCPYDAVKNIPCLYNNTVTQYITNPLLINDAIFIKVRQLSDGVWDKDLSETEKRDIEISHMYEIYNYLGN